MNSFIFVPRRSLSSLFDAKIMQTESRTKQTRLFLMPGCTCFRFYSYDSKKRERKLLFVYAALHPFYTTLLLIIIPLCYDATNIRILFVIMS